MACQNRHDLVVNVLHITLVAASTMHWGITQCKDDNMTVLLVVTSMPTYIREFRAHFFLLHISAIGTPVPDLSPPLLKFEMESCCEMTVSEALEHSHRLRYFFVHRHQVGLLKTN